PAGLRPCWLGRTHRLECLDGQRRPSGPARTHPRGAAAASGPGLRRVTDPANPLRVLVAGRHPVVRAGFRGLLAVRDDVEVVGEATSADDLDALVADLQADVVLYEWSPTEVFPSSEPTPHSDVPILLMGALGNQGELSQLLETGARGFLLQDATGDEVVEAAYAIAHGLVVLDSALAAS